MSTVTDSQTEFILEKIQRHRAFWDGTDLGRPLLGFAVGNGGDAWSYWLTNPGARALWNQRDISPDSIDPRAFVPEQRAYLERTAHIGDDALRTAIPFPSIPWMEAIVGCRVASTDFQFVSRSFLDNILEYRPVRFDPDNAWVRKYIEFLEVYYQAFGGYYPVGQSVLRGASDLLAALLGPQAAIESLVTEPVLAKRMLEDLNEALFTFLRFQQPYIREFHGGRVLGQYELWAPGTVQRIQEDNLALYSPDLYREFLKPLNVRITRAASYTLLHLHSSALFLLDDLLTLPGVGVYQFSKDEGECSLQVMLPQLRYIQERGKCLLLKGRFDTEDLVQLKRRIAPVHLYLQPVVDSMEEARDMLPALRAW